VVLPSSEIAQTAAAAARSRSASKDYVAQVEYKGVSSMFADDLNMADLNVSPQKKVSSSKPETQFTPQQQQPVPVVLPSADLLGAKNSGKEGKQSQQTLQPLTNWSGVSSQFQDEHNIKMHASPEPAPRPQEPKKAPDPETAAEPEFVFREPTNVAPAASRSRGASKDYASACMQPVQSYTGVAASIAADDYQHPSPDIPRRARKGSRDAEDAFPVEKAAAPAPETEVEVDEYAAKREAFVAQAKAEAARKSHTSNHYGFSPLSSIH